MDERVPGWIRIGIAVTLAVPQLVTGVWAVLAPAHWWEHFPGIGPALVSATPPFNEHLVGDVGAGFLATGVALAMAAASGRASDVRLALVTYLVFTVPHVVHHATHDAPGLTASEDLANVALLASGAVLAVAFALAARRAVSSPPSSDPELRAGDHR